jgi:hypothetical protein
VHLVSRVDEVLSLVLERPDHLEPTPSRAAPSPGEMQL